MPPAPTHPGDHERVRSLLKRINEAWVNGRWEDLAGCFHEAMVIVAPGFQETQRGRDACVDGYRAFVTAATIHEYTESDAVIDLWGDIAVATYRFRIAYDMDGKSYRESGWDVFVFGRDNGTWRAVWRTLMVSA